MAEVASAYVSLLPSAKGFGRQLDAQVGPQLDTAGRSGGKRFGGVFGSAFRGALAGIGIATAVRGAVGLLSSSLDEAREAQKVGAQTAQVIKTTGGAANITAKQVGNLATAISLKTGKDDEAIQSGANLLLTFKNVRNEVGKGNQVFNRATKAAVDLSAAGFGDLSGASKQLGKALNDPVKGITALGRAGVTFTDSQKAQIKAMVANNDVLGAQKIILKEVESQVGGSAAAQATAGEKMSVAWANLKEQIGTALLPVIDKFATTMTTKVVPSLSVAIAFLQKNPGVIYGFAAAVGALAVAFVAAQIAAFAIPLAIAALVAGIVYAYTKFQTFRDIVNGTFMFLKTIVSTVLPYVVGFFKGQLDVFLGVVKVFTSLFKGDWKGVWDGIKQIVRGTLSSVKALMSGGFAALKAIVRALGGALLSLAKAAFGKLRDGAVSGVRNLVSYVKNLPGRIKGALGDLGSMLYNAGRDLIAGLINGIKSKIGDVGSAMKGIAGKVKGFLPGSPVKEGPLTSWNNGGAGKRLVDQGIIAGLDSRRGALTSAMNDLASAGALTRSVRLPGGTRLDAATFGASGSKSSGIPDMPIVDGSQVIGYLRDVATAQARIEIARDDMTGAINTRFATL